METHTIAGSGKLPSADFETVDPELEGGIEMVAAAIQCNTIASQSMDGSINSTGCN